MHIVEVKDQQVVGPRTKHIDGNDARMHFTRKAMTADKVKSIFVFPTENDSAILTKNVIEKLCPIDNVADLLKLNGIEILEGGCRDGRSVIRQQSK
jgi:hypothetical protein